MRRLFWLGVGVAVGAVATRRVSRAVDAYSPQGVAASLQSSAVGALGQVRSFVADVRAASAEREGQIRAAVAVEADLRAGRLDHRDAHQ